MDVVTFTEASARLKDVMDRAIKDREPVVITRQKSESVVVVSLADWNAIEKTLHLLATPANAERLRQSIQQIDAGKGVERDLVRP